MINATVRLNGNVITETIAGEQFYQLIGTAYLLQATFIICL
jgi:hypothetical protein